MTTIDNLRPKEEAVLLGVDGIADFNGLHSRNQDDDVQLYAFDVLMSVGDDLRPLPLHLRKNHLAKVLRRRVDGVGQAVLLLG